MSDYLFLVYGLKTKLVISNGCFTFELSDGSSFRFVVEKKVKINRMKFN